MLQLLIPNALGISSRHLIQNPAVLSYTDVIDGAHRSPDTVLLLAPVCLRWEQLGLVYNLLHAVVGVEVVYECDYLREDRLAIGDQSVQQLFVLLHVVAGALAETRIVLFGLRLDLFNLDVVLQENPL